jgi:SET domain
MMSFKAHTIPWVLVSLLHTSSSSDAFLLEPRSIVVAGSHKMSSSWTELRMAKSAKKTNNKRGGPSSGGGGLKGFGSPTTIKNKEVEVDIDRTKTARDFYDYLSQKDAGDNLARCALGYFPLEGADVKLRGVVAMKDIKKGETLIRIPYEASINLGQEGADPSIPALNFLREYCQVMGGTTAQTGTENRPYFDMLPKFRGDDCLGSTDFFSDEALDALQSPLIAEETRSRRERTKARFDADVDDTFPVWIDGTSVTVDHLQWAVWLITSRVLTVQGAEGEGKAYKLLIPFLDMCNHDLSSPHILTGRAAPCAELKIVAGSAVKEGEQIIICYSGGIAGNDRFIQDYGFLDTSDDAKAYTMVAQQLVGKRRIVEGVGAGKLMLRSDMERSMKTLQSTSIEEDRKLLEGATDPQLRAAYRYRLGVKEALSRVIVV